METIKAVKEFKGLKDSRTDYERAERYLPVLEKALIEPFRRRICRATGFSDYNLPMAIIQKVVRAGDFRFGIQIEPRRRTPAYKGIVEGFEGFLRGLDCLAARKMTVTRVVKEDGMNYLNSGDLWGIFSSIAYGELADTAEFNVLSTEPCTDAAGEIILPERIVLNTECATAYLGALRIAEGMKTLVKQYKEALAKEAKRSKDETVQLTKRISYKVESSKGKGPNWGHVVKTLIRMPTEPERKGELEMIADEGFGMDDRIARFGGLYDLIEHKTPNGFTLYVGVQSVGYRIEDLKEEQPITRNVKRVKHQEVV